MDDSPTRPVHQQAAPPGWYPADGGVLRYWNGWQWTAHEQPMPPAYAWPADHGKLGYRMPHQVEIVSDRRVSSVEATLAWVFTILTLGYLLPWAVAATRGKSNSLAIGLVNFFLGWTFIGWLVALVMACQSHQVAGYR